MCTEVARPPYQRLRGLARLFGCHREKKVVIVEEGSVDIKGKAGTKEEVSVDCEISRKMADEISRKFSLKFRYEISSEPQG